MACVLFVAFVIWAFVMHVPSNPFYLSYFFILDFSRSLLPLYLTEILRPILYVVGYALPVLLFFILDRLGVAIDRVLASRKDTKKR